MKVTDADYYDPKPVKSAELQALELISEQLSEISSEIRDLNHNQDALHRDATSTTMTFVHKELRHIASSLNTLLWIVGGIGLILIWHFKR